MQVGAGPTTIAQAGAIGNQGVSSNIQRFEAHRPLTYGRRGLDGEDNLGHWKRIS